MPLNDPRWGRDSEEPDKKDSEAQSSEDSRDSRQDARQSRDDDSVSSNFRKNRNSANNRGDAGDDMRDKLDKDLNEVRRTIEEKLARILGIDFKEGDDEAKRRSRLKSRDDFSRDDIEDAEPPRESRAGRSEEPRRSRQKAGDGNNWRPPIPPITPRGFGTGTRFGMGLLLLVALVGWAATGFYIVPEGQTGIVTTFGRYSESTPPGFRWHVPMPVQDVQLVDVSSVRTAEIGAASQSNRLSEALMLTDDENIVDMQFTVQYRIKPGQGARDYVFNIRQPERTVVQAAESAMREVVGRKTMDSVLFESKAEIAEAVRTSMQDMLDRYTSGIEIMSVAIQNAQPPQQVQAAFNDAVKAGQDRERSINLGEEYRNAVLPRAQGTAARLKEDAMGYQARIVETAKGDAARFAKLQTEYAKAPEVTRDRLYIDAVRDVLSHTTKVFVDSRSGNNMLYLPLEKIVESTKQSAEDAVNQAARRDSAPSTGNPTPAQAMGGAQQSGTDRSHAMPEQVYRLSRER